MSAASPSLSLSCLDEREVTPEQDAAIRALLCACFPDDAATFAHTRAWHGSGPEFSIVCFEGGRAVAHAGVVVREIACDGRPVRIGGVQNVAVAPTHRRTGLARRVMQEAMQRAVPRGIPYGLLFCVPELAHFYGSLGWTQVESRVTMLDGDGRVVSVDPKNIMLVKHLSGPPFIAREVYLQGADW